MKLIDDKKLGASIQVTKALMNQNNHKKTGQFCVVSTMKDQVLNLIICHCNCNCNNNMTQCSVKMYNYNPELHCIR
jgi:hypothetical protein